MLINAVAYEQGKRLRDVRLSEIPELLALPEIFVWVALRDADAGELEFVRQTFGLHELAIEDVRKGNQTPKIEEYEDVLFASLRLVELQGPETHYGEVHVFTGPNFVLSVRSRSEQNFLGVRARAPSGSRACWRSGRAMSSTRSPMRSWTAISRSSMRSNSSSNRSRRRCSAGSRPITVR